MRSIHTSVVLAAFVAACLVALAPTSSHAIGRGGRGGGGGGGGMRMGGGASMGGGMRTGGGMPMGGGRPGMSSAPNFGTRPNMQRPQMPQGGFQGGFPQGGMSRPTMNRPQGNYSGNRGGGAGGYGYGGMKPNANRPTTLPGGLGGAGGANRLPSIGGGASSLPHLGGNPSFGSRPGAAGGSGMGNRPGGATGFPGSRPTTRPAARPTPGSLDNFLGIKNPGGGNNAVRPGRPGAGGATTLPGQIGGGNAGVRPGQPGRPGGATTLPGQIGNRPGGGAGNRPGGGSNWPGGKPPAWIGGGNGTRPWNPGGNNNNIHRPPQWANRPGVGNINNNWNNIVNRPGHPGMNNWLGTHPSRYARWNYWGSDVRQHLHGYGNCFGHNWWNSHYHNLGGWHYMYWNRPYAWSYWWGVPSYGNLVNWFTWSAPQAVWSQPIYYDYGSGGNVYYEDNNVYVGGQQVGSSADFAASAAALATVAPPKSQAEAEAAEWMPLGTFAVSSDDADTNPDRVVQLAVNKAGVVSGTLYNSTTDESKTLLGQVDKQTQRVALRIGESEDVVMETGLYNLTQDEAPVLVHFGAKQVEYWLLVRLKSEDSGAQ